MQLATLTDGVSASAVAIDPERGAVPLADLDYPGIGSVRAAIERLAPADFDRLVAAIPTRRFSPVGARTFLAPIADPPKVWGIGLNYRDHADDLSAPYPDEPASFLKAAHTFIGPGQAIPLPHQSQRVTAEAEIGLVIGRYCRDVSEEEALAYVWGVCPVLDQTAEDILQRNPRFLTRAKNFPGFLSTGPAVTSLPAVLARVGTLSGLEVATVRNGEVHRANTMQNMLFGPEFLVSFHSQMMPLYPGDIICTGTPGAISVHHGDTAECRIAGLDALVNPVERGRYQPLRT